MLEHREPPRIGPDHPTFDAVSELGGSRVRLRRFESPAALRRIDYPRAVLWLAGILVVLAGLLWGWRMGVDWLVRQSPYQVRFDQIQLIDASGLPTEPPSWFRGGLHSFLENARISAREPETFSVLAVTPERLRSVFEKCPWVEDVVRVPPYGFQEVRVELRFRTPVALVKTRDGEPLVVDDDATVLPALDVEPVKLDQLVKIAGDVSQGGLARPSDTHFGVKWKSLTGHNGEEQVDARILAAARLAGFVARQSQASDAASSPALRFEEIIVTDYDKPDKENGRRGLFVVNGERSVLWWGDAPGFEAAGRLTADAKWAILKRWAQTTAARVLDREDYWAFSRDGLKNVCPHLDPSHRPRAASR